MDKKKLIEQANVYKAGDDGIDLDESDFWLWEQHNHDIDFVLKLANKKVTCMNPKEIWCMDAATAKESEVIDITNDYCTECKFKNKCNKISIIEEINSDDS